MSNGFRWKPCREWRFEVFYARFFFQESVSFDPLEWFQWFDETSKVPGIEKLTFTMAEAKIYTNIYRG